MERFRNFGKLPFQSMGGAELVSSSGTARGSLRNGLLAEHRDIRWQVLRDAFSKTDMELSKSRIDLSSSGYSAVCVLIMGNRLVYAGKSGSPVVAAANSQPENGGEWRVSSVDGRRESAEVFIRERVISSDERFMILGSRGVWECMSGVEAVVAVQAHWTYGRDIENACNRLIMEALNRWKPEGGDGDGVAAIIVSFRHDV